MYTRRLLRTVGWRGSLIIHPISDLIYAICYTVKRLTVLQKNIPAAVDFVKTILEERG